MIFTTKLAFVYVKQEKQIIGYALFKG